VSGPSASVVLCTYNGAAYLREQLASLARQSRLPAELVVGDDGSTDATLAILERFAATAPFPVHVVCNERNLGYRANFVRTAGRASADLLFFCDQDDIWKDDKVERVTAAFAPADVLLVYHNAVLVGPEGCSMLARLFDPLRQRALLSQSPMPPWHYTLGFTQAFRRELLAYDNLWPSSLDHMADKVMAHDQWFMFLALALGRVEFLDADLVAHRQHGDNAYGVVRASPWRRLLSRFSHQPEWDCLAATAATRRAEVLGELARRSSGDRLGQAEAMYRELARQHARRLASYTLPAFRSRLRAFGEGLAARDYRSKPQGLGRAALPRDFVAGVLALSRR
jgi:glycosyltransferase involved in cell wall biosynthesis